MNREAVSLKRRGKAHLLLKNPSVAQGGGWGVGYVKIQLIHVVIQNVI